MVAKAGMLCFLDGELTLTPSSVPIDADTLYLQFNELTGAWPLAFCAEDTTLLDFGLDCDQISCDPACCTPLECYYAE